MAFDNYYEAREIIEDIISKDLLGPVEQDEVICGEKPLDCSFCQIGDVHMHILAKTVYLDVVPKEIVKEIFEDIFLCLEYENGKLVIDHDKIVGIKNKFQRRLKL